MTIDLATTRGRLRAYYELLVEDHGFIRTLYRNWFVVAPGVFRSSQPSPIHVKSAARRGVKTIINLRGASPKGFYLLEKEACDAHGILLVDIVLRSRELPSAETLRAAASLLETIEYPILIHCKSGADRAGFLAVLYMMLQKKKSVEAALSQLKWLYGHYRVSKTGVLDKFFEAYVAERDATGIGFWEWVDTGYDPVAIRQEFRSSRLQSFLVDKVLRRE